MILVSIDDRCLQLLFHERMKNDDFKILFFLEDYSGRGKLSSISDGARHAKGSGVTGSPSARDGQEPPPTLCPGGESTDLSCPPVPLF